VVVVAVEEFGRLKALDSAPAVKMELKGNG
jgi:hypothetical protein